MRIVEYLKRAEEAIWEPLSASPPTWRGKARRLLSIWRQPSFDPYASWTVFDASDVWVRRVVADLRDVSRPMGDVQIYVADALAEKVAIRRLVAEVLAADATPPRSPGIVLDGMRLGIRADDFDVWWHSHLTTPLNGLWLRARQLLDANMPTCTVAIQSAHQWTEAS